MSKKKHNSKNKNAKPAPKKSNHKVAWIVGAVVVAAVVGVIAMSSGSSQDQSATALSPQEQEYAGRFLPANYVEPTVAERTLYTSTVQMSVVSSTPNEGGVSIPLDGVTAGKIVQFDYQKADGQTLPMIAYVKPSGNLFVGVNYCPPCEGEGQRIEADGTLTCESCGTKRNLETNAGISGACKLYPLDEVPSTVEGDKILVDGSALDSWTAQPLDRPVGG